ncbi:trypsin-4 [Plutella xylostella]|uniref:trypsin-4 n=1 Tax=Plutella xylostella TaxID=51655 RepID=UPI002032AD25|nr:trypsin-4 [Plutella xylostella]
MEVKRNVQSKMASLSLSMALLLLVGLLECARAFNWRANHVDESSGEMFQLQEAARVQLKFAASPEVVPQRRSGHHQHQRSRKKAKKHGHNYQHLRRFSPVTNDTQNDDENQDVDLVTTITPVPDTSTPHAISTDIQEAPFMAAVLLNRQLWCTGVIIDGDKVLTAAHCLQLQHDNRFFKEYVKLLSVRVGSSDAAVGGEVLWVTDIVFHPNYKPETLEFNLAVVRLSKNLTFGRDSDVDKIEVSREDFIPNDNNVTFLGWGDVSGEEGDVQSLQRLELPVYDYSDCQEVYGKELVTRNHFCAGFITSAKNVCRHGAGGAAVLDGQLAGLLTFSSSRCGPDQPAVFTATGSVVSWLDSVGDNTYVKNAGLRRRFG